MNESNNLQTLIGPDESTRVMGALQRGVSRRDVLAMLTAGGMHPILAGTLAAAAGAAHAEKPRRGGRIRVAGSAASVKDTLDPAKQSNHTDYIRGNMFYNGLTSLDGSLTPQPALAEEFSTRDLITWVFKLRRGVVFHDGKPFTPADVVFSIMRHKNPATGSKAQSLADQIEEVKATGPHEVTIKLVAPNADLPAILGTYHFHILRDGTTDFNAANSGVGTGPYKVKEFKPGVRSIAVRNESYWRPGRPYLDEIEYIGVSDEAARINALLSGELDLIGSVNPRSVQRIRDSRQHAVFETRSGGYTDLIIRRDAGPGTNPDFVLGMKHLLEREPMKRSVVLDYAVVANDQPIDPTNRFYFAGLRQRSFDPDKAQFHLRKANLGSTPIPVVASAAATYSVEMAQALQQSAQKLGLNLEVKQMAADGYWSNHWMKHPVGFGSVNARPSADVLFSQFFKSDAPWNESGWKNPKFDQLLVAARGEANLAKRTRMYADMQVMIHEDSGIGIPLFLSSLDGHSKKLKGLSPIPLGGMMGFAFAEHVWLQP